MNWRRACRAVAASALLGVYAQLAAAAVQEPGQASVLPADDARPPARDRAWKQVTLPDHREHSPDSASATWYRFEFETAGAAAGEGEALYLPYLDYGGDVWLNGTLVQRIAQNTDELHVRWTRPHLVQLPAWLLRDGRNEVMLRLPPPQARATVVPRPSIGTQSELARLYDRRFFWVMTAPQITAAVCGLVAACFLFIWWRVREETIYGLFGIAAALWGLRTLTFVVETVPAAEWYAWRLTYLAATGGFITLMALLALRLAGIHDKRVERALGAYWLVGPAWLLAQGASAEPLVNRWWIAGFLPIGAAIVAVSFRAVRRRRTLASAVLPAAMTIAVLTGVHDYLVAWNLGHPAQLLPGWAGHRIYLLHHGANLVLVAMGGLLTARFVRALRELETMNATLERRVADRERELAGNYERMAALERQNAASQERQRIMREIHDGLGSQLFVSLSRVERGDMQAGQVADALRDCIGEMRLALDTLAPGEQDFRALLGNFLFRWDGQLRSLGVALDWAIEVPDEALVLSPHAALQLLRVAQEALTNVVKHAHATHVQVRLKQGGGMLELEVEDDGDGHAAAWTPTAASHGLQNMEARARQLGGRLAVRRSGHGTCVALHLPVAAPTA